MVRGGALARFMSCRGLVMVVVGSAILSGLGCSGALAAPNVPYRLDGPLPTQVRSPAIAKGAPYTPLVRSLIKQLEPTDPPTAADLINADRLFAGFDNLTGTMPGSSCHTVGIVDAPTGTNPSIAPLCWSDSVGINVLGGPNEGRTTATPEPLALGATFDPRLANAWGQVEGVEGRELTVTGLYGPELDISVQPNWERGLDTMGEDPYLNGVMGAAQVNGMQGRGLMSQVKHFAAFSGADRYHLTTVGDQALHQMLLAPFEPSFTSAKAASTMCAYDEFHDTSSGLPQAPDVLFTPSPYGKSSMKTWPLDEAHWSCEQPLTLTYVLRDLWHSVAFVASDYPATHSTNAFTQGESQELPSPAFFGPTDPTTAEPPVATVGQGSDPTGDACEVGTLPAKCSATGARHIAGIPGADCDPDDGCGLITAVTTGNLPLAVFNQGLAEILYQEQRFGLLGCDQTPRAKTCTNPGGVDGNRRGNAMLPKGPASEATARKNLGTEAGDAAVVERTAQEGAVLLKDVRSALPLTRRVLRRGVAVSGAGADYLIAAPSNEASTGFPDRDAISPLLQLKSLAPRGSHIAFTAALDPTGIPVPASQLSTGKGTGTGGLQRTAGPGSPAKDPTLDFTTAGPRKPLSPGDYTWSGYLDVPRSDSYTFRFQYSPATSSATGPVTLDLDGAPKTLSKASSFYCGQYYDHNICTPDSTTDAGYTQGGLTNVQTTATTLGPGEHSISITFDNRTSAPASFRFAYSRATGDALDAAAAARRKAAAVVFVNDNGISVVNQDAYTPPSLGVATLPAAQVALIDAVAKVNRDTIVVMNTADPVVVAPWINNPHVRAVLEMWNAGEEGGTATARLLLGQADPSGHTTITWPRAPQDTIWGYSETRPLFPGDHTGKHPERLNGLTDPSSADCQSYVPAETPCTMTDLDEGIFSGYRFYDKEHLTPQFPFGFGLSYTRFAFSHPRTRYGAHDTLAVSFTVRNTGKRAGTDVAQIYVGPGPALNGVQQAVRALEGFARVPLAPGRSRRVTISLAARAFQYWNVRAQRWSTDPGRRVVWIGDADSVRRLPLRVGVRIRR